MLTFSYNKTIDREKQKESLLAFPTWRPKSISFVKNKINEYQKYWDEIAPAFSVFLQMKGYKVPRQLAYVVSGTPSDTSFPAVIMKSRYDKNEFLPVAIHEALHVVLRHNKEKIPAFLKDSHPVVKSHWKLYKLAKEFHALVDIPFPVPTEKNRLEAYKK